MNKTKVSFKVESNQAILLIAFHDLITNVDPEDSIPLSDNFDWMIDEIAARIERLVECSIHSSGTVNEESELSTYVQVLLLESRRRSSSV